MDGPGNNAPYKKTLSTGKETCCDWRKIRCNRSGKADEKPWFEARKVVGLMEWIWRHEFYASHTVRLVAHKGAGGWRWGRRADPWEGASEESFRDKFMCWLTDSLAGARAPPRAAPSIAFPSCYTARGAKGTAKAAAGRRCPIGGGTG